MDNLRAPFFLPVERGVRTSDSARARETRRGHGTRRESLLLVIEPSTASGETSVVRAQAAAAQEFQRNSGAATSTVFRAIQAVDRVFRAENTRSLPEHRVNAAALAILVRDHQCFVACAGKAYAFTRHRGRLVRVIEPDPTTSPYPLGQATPSTPQLGACELLPVEGLLAVVGARVPVTDVEWLSLFDLPAGTAAERLRVAAGPHGSFGAVMLPPLIEPPAEIDPAASARITRLADRRPDHRLARTAGPVEPLDVAPRLDRVRRRPAGRLSERDFGRSGPGVIRHPARKRARRSEGARQVLAAASSYAQRFDPRPLVGILREFLPSEPAPTRMNHGGAAVAAIDARHWGSTPAMKLPDVAAVLRLPAVVLVVFAAMVAVAAIAWWVPSMFRPQEVGVSKMLDAADSARLKALVLSDRDQTRRELNGVMKVVQDAVAKDSTSVRAQQLLVMVESDLNRLDAVYRLPDLKVLLSPNGLQPGARGVSQVTRREGDLIALDRGAGRGYRVALGPTGATLAGVNPLPTPVVRQADSGDTRPAAIQTLVWMPAGSARTASGTLAMDQERNLWEIDSSGQLQRLVLRGANAWQSYKSALGYQGNLYVLDPKANQIWRYTPTQDGYNSEPKAMLEAARINDAVDFAIDGSIYVLTSGGKVWKFSSGVPRELPLRGIDRPLQHPGGLFTDADSKQIWIADAGNRRIVVLDKEGAYIRQVALDAAVSDLVVDEAKRHIYYVSEGQLLVSGLP